MEGAPILVRMSEAAAPEPAYTLLRAGAVVGVGVPVVVGILFGLLDDVTGISVQAALPEGFARTGWAGLHLVLLGLMWGAWAWASYRMLADERTGLSLAIGIPLGFFMVAVGWGQWFTGGLLSGALVLAGCLAAWRRGPRVQEEPVGTR